MRNEMRNAKAGFTLIELLVVMAIVVALGGLGLVGIKTMLRSSDEKAVSVVLSQLDAQIKTYERDPQNGDFPPTLLEREAFPGVGSLANKTNCGIESLLVCLASKRSGGDFNEGQIPWSPAIENFDEDFSETPMTTLSEGRDLYEVIDRWGTPLAYFHWRDYAQVEAKDLGRVSSAEGTGDIRAKPWRNEKTKQFYNRDTFQLISAGADGVFNTEDDVTNFQR